MASGNYSIRCFDSAESESLDDDTRDRHGNHHWSVTSAPPRLASGEIHIWRCNLDTCSLSALSLLLSKDEKARADRFAFEKDRIQFVAGRGTLRKILGRYLDESPERLGFEIGSFGKPNLSNGNGWLRFNISHSRGMVVIAVALNREVGIDLEFVDQKFDVQGVAPSVFSEEEVNSLRSLLPDRQVDAFFTGWTRKEALLKAMGDGLSSSEEFQGIHIFIPDLNTSYKSFKNDRCTEWALTSFRVDDDFKAAIAVEGSLGAIRFLETFDAHDKQTGV